ncbi:MAG: hypothetical protein HY784_07815 [Chloroflexi bacterium]|nr:hypothetical protein [Chloroflexota bacterium]
MSTQGSFLKRIVLVSILIGGMGLAALAGAGAGGGAVYLAVRDRLNSLAAASPAPVETTGPVVSTASPGATHTTVNIGRI